MHESLGTLIMIGTIGWFILIARDTIIGCAKGHAPTAIINCLVLSIINVEIWALLPAELAKLGGIVIYLLLWAVALLPYFIFIYLSLSRFRRGSKSDKNTDA